jgi:hypothetical protein
MSFNPQGYPFTALPTNLRGKIQPYQLAVLWVIQSYASKDDQQCYPSLNTIATAACMSKRHAMRVVNQLVSMGYLERKHQKGKNGEQGSNLYKVTIWHLANVPEPSVDGRGTSVTPHSTSVTTLWTDRNPPIDSQSPKLDPYKLDTNNNIKKAPKQKIKKIIYSEEFELFWEKYLKIKKRASGQTKPKAYDHYCVIIKNHSPKSLALALQRAITDQHQIETKGGFASPFPNCCRWLKDGFYEAYLPSTVDLPKPKQNWEKDKSQDLPF